MKVRIDSSRLERKLGKVQKEAPRLYLDSLMKRTKNRTPVDTGTLKSSWIIRGLVLLNNTPYVKPVEFGTRYQPAQLMLTTSILESGRDWEKAIKKAYR